MKKSQISITPFVNLQALDLGDRAPVIDYIHTTVDTESDEVIFDLSARYHCTGMASVNVNTNDSFQIPVTVGHVSVANLRLRIVLPTFDDKFPIIPSFQIFLLEPPVVDWICESTAAKVSLL